MLYRVMRCADCGRPIVPDIGNGNYVQSNLGSASDEDDDRIEVWRHVDHDRAPDEVLLGGPDREIGEGVRDFTGELCVVTKVGDGESWCVLVKDLGRQPDL